MNKPNSILNHIVNITANKDIEILEISLMRTIYEVISCKKIYFIKIDNPIDLTDLNIHYISCYDEAGYSKRLSINSHLINLEILNYLKANLNVKTTHNVLISDHFFTVCPIEALQKIIGFIAIEAPEISSQNVHVFECLVKIFQNYVSVLVDNERDTLTGLLNRKTFDDKIMKLIETMKKSSPDNTRSDNERRSNDFERFWLGIFDIDNFKRINDTFGHVFGDEILILMSRIIQDIFRFYDMKFRYGGEEFIVIVKAENQQSAFNIFERFRLNVENYRFPQIGKLTISIGIVEITGYDSPSAFVGCADRALYYGKEHGKNITCIYSELVEQGLLQPENHFESKIILFE